MITIFAGNFAPRGWAFCNGQTMSIAQYSALFSLLGTTYGGNGTTTFNLPDLRGRVPIGMGQGPNLTPRVEGEMSGEENHTLISTEMPMHNHLVSTTAAVGTVQAPGTSFPASTPRGTTPIYGATTDGTTLSPQAVSLAGGSQPHNNMQPYLVTNYIIALQGIFPSRN